MTLQDMKAGWADFVQNGAATEGRSVTGSMAWPLFLALDSLIKTDLEAIVSAATPAERVADDVRLRAELQRIDRLNAARKADEYRGKAAYWQGIADG